MVWPQDPLERALVAGGLSDPLSVMRSLPLQAASNHAQTMTGRVRRRQAMWTASEK